MSEQSQALEELISLCQQLNEQLQTRGRSEMNLIYVDSELDLDVIIDAILDSED